MTRLRKERDGLHSQYAREIEAAHAHTGARETELSTQYFSQLQKMRQEHEQSKPLSSMSTHILSMHKVLFISALSDLRTAHQQSLEQLRQNLNSASELERQSMCSRHQEEMDVLRRELEEKKAYLAKLTSELTAAVDEKEHGLEEVQSKVKQLKEEGRVLREKEQAARKEVEQLKVSFLWLTHAVMY